MGTIDLVVGGQDRPSSGPLNCGLERRQVNLVQGPWLDVRTHGHAPILGFIADEVLNGRHDATQRP